MRIGRKPSWWFLLAMVVGVGVTFYILLSRTSSSLDTSSEQKPTISIYRNSQLKKPAPQSWLKNPQPHARTLWDQPTERRVAECMRIMKTERNTTNVTKDKIAPREKNTTDPPPDPTDLSVEIRKEICEELLEVASQAVGIYAADKGSSEGIKHNNTAQSSSSSSAARKETLSRTVLIHAFNVNYIPLFINWSCFTNIPYKYLVYVNLCPHTHSLSRSLAPLLSLRLRFN